MSGRRVLSWRWSWVPQKSQKEQHDRYASSFILTPRWICLTVTFRIVCFRLTYHHRLLSMSPAIQKGAKGAWPVPRVEVPKTPPPIEVPVLPLDLVKERTGNFGPKALIGEGSYGRVYYANLDGEKAIAVKKLDVSSMPDSEVEFLTRVWCNSSFSFHVSHTPLVRLSDVSSDLGFRGVKIEERELCRIARLLRGWRPSPSRLRVCNHGIFAWYSTRYMKLNFFLFRSFHSIVLPCYVVRVSWFPIIVGKKGVPDSKPGPVLDWMQRVRIAVDAAKGLEFLHEKVNPPIIHRDIRSSNVLLMDDFRAKIADFNLSNQPPDMAARLHSTRVLGTFGYHAPE